VAPVLLDDEFDFAAPEVQMFFLQLCEGLLKGTPLLEQQNAGRTCFGTGFRNYALGTSYGRFPLPREAFPHALHTFANGYHSWAKGTMGFAPPRNPEAEPAADGGTTLAPQPLAPLARGNTAMLGGNLTWLAVKLTAAFDSRAPSSILEQVSVLQWGESLASHSPHSGAGVRRLGAGAGGDQSGRPQGRPRRRADQQLVGAHVGGGRVHLGNRLRHRHRLPLHFPGRLPLRALAEGRCVTEGTGSSLKALL
jgi:hypothetical protein